MTTVTQHQAPLKIFYAHLDFNAGTLAKLDGALVFMNAETYELTTIEPEHIPFLTVLGEVGLADCQQLRDQMAGGPAAIACSRGEAWTHHMLTNKCRISA